MHFINAFKCIMTDNVGMTIIVHNHVHLCNTSYFVIDFDSIKMFCCKIMPIVKVIDGAFLIIVACLLPHVIKCVQKETAGTTRRIKDIPILFWLHHFYTEFNNGTRRKVLSKIALKETIHKLLKSNALNIKVSFIEVNSL